MGKLTTLRPQVATLGTRLHAPSTRIERERYRDAQPWRRWYKTAAWRTKRWAILVRDRFTCQWPGCGKVEGDTSKLVADHRRAHRGDEALFWDEANLWTLCEHCHNSAKQAEERGGR